MNANYTYLDQLDLLLDEIPPDSILSRTVFQDQSLKILLFVFQPGQELSEHTAAVPAILHFLEGEADLTLGEESKSARTGTWVHMPPNLPHSIHAASRTIMMLTLVL